ncbi:MAG: hypothetical protein EOM14_09740 [Clostridia bacterium]|nr:hypothetical protein [Clostridia bacterium]
MKKVSLIIKIEEDKLNAIKYYMVKKDADLERELGEALEKIYEKYAPAAVREYIDECGTDSKARPSAPKKEATKSRPAL